MNDTVFVECAEILGRRLMSDRSGSAEDRLRNGFRLCLARDPAAAELTILRRLYDNLLENCRANPEAAAKLAGAMKADGNVAETAAWVAMARALMNLDEYLTRE